MRAEPILRTPNPPDGSFAGAAGRVRQAVGPRPHLLGGVRATERAQALSGAAGLDPLILMKNTMRQLVAEWQRLTEFLLPAYSPDLNPSRAYGRTSNAA